MKTEEKILLNIICDLQERFEKLTEYDLLKASGLIRQLIVDTNPIIEQVNKNYKLKIVYRVQKRFKMPAGKIDEDGTIWKPLYGMTFIAPKEDSSNIELLKKDEFFKYELLHYNGESFSVLDIIKICANKYGGIHYDETKNQKELLIDTTHFGLTFNNSSSVLQSMYSIIEICLEAFNPLILQIKSNYGT
ncbi:hypothetical protein SLW70_08045 [Flavobacterium sp. NG2]|uniref:hypothetical protein n=1 Tax=Flavobacterium sp. NG2 TaxID=3097547 RepID=UPI002A7F4C6F|nr:hypothetical protein [Flavobacterium sp. NG2]WPR73056.1 hypothetical protein SLW70_08045 [Flavobacterium sp. NG2]